MHPLKLRKIGSSVGVILPKELLERLNLREGDKLYADENRCTYPYPAYSSHRGS